MSKNRIPVNYTEPCVLHNPEKGWWQCGIWVRSVELATVYPDVHEANQVMLYRTLPSSTVVELL